MREIESISPSTRIDWNRRWPKARFARDHLPDRGKAKRQGDSPRKLTAELTKLHFCCRSKDITTPDVVTLSFATPCTLRSIRRVSSLFPSDTAGIRRRKKRDFPRGSHRVQPESPEFTRKRNNLAYLLRPITLSCIRR